MILHLSYILCILSTLSESSFFFTLVSTSVNGMHQNQQQHPSRNAEYVVLISNGLCLLSNHGGTVQCFREVLKEVPPQLLPNMTFRNYRQLVLFTKVLAICWVRWGSRKDNWKYKMELGCISGAYREGENMKPHTKISNLNGRKNFNLLYLSSSPCSPPSSILNWRWGDRDIRAEKDLWRTKEKRYFSIQ